MVLQFQLSQK